MDPSPVAFIIGIIVKIEPVKSSVNKSLSDSALNVNWVSPSISVALRPIPTSISSKVDTLEIATIEGASLTGAIVTSKLIEEETSPSEADAVIVVLPLKLESGLISIK